jgi:uncharacterized protein (UPF0332 family)
MNDTERNQYVAYRLETALNVFKAARILADNGLWLSAVNRLYYASFYSINALLVHKSIHVKTHSGVRTEFSKHFIKTGLFEMKFGQLFSELFDLRQKGDYGSIMNYNEELMASYFIPVQELIDAVEKFIHESEFQAHTT